MTLQSFKMIQRSTHNIHLFTLAICRKLSLNYYWITPVNLCLLLLTIFSCIHFLVDDPQACLFVFAGSSRETEGPCELWTTETFTIDHCGDPNTGNLTFADEGQKFISAFQALSVRNGHAMCNSDSATGDPWDSQQIPGDGVFWKSSEFHRRSGKQGLEERFRLLSPTVIVNCLVGNSGEGKVQNW